MDLFLRIAGVILATGSIIFAVCMIELSGGVGLRWLFNHTTESGRPGFVIGSKFHYSVSDARSLDFTVVGSVPTRPATSVLQDFDLLECDGVTARIRTPQGRVLRASAGSRLSGAGKILSILRQRNSWIVTAEMGQIVSR